MRETCICPKGQGSRGARRPALRLSEEPEESKFPRERRGSPRRKLRSNCVFHSTTVLRTGAARFKRQFSTAISCASARLDSLKIDLAESFLRWAIYEALDCDARNALARITVRLMYVQRGATAFAFATGTQDCANIVSTFALKNRKLFPYFLAICCQETFRCREQGVAVEKVAFSEKSRQSGDRKCPGD